MGSDPLHMPTPAESLQGGAAGAGLDWLQQTEPNFFVFDERQSRAESHRPPIDGKSPWEATACHRVGGGKVPKKTADMKIEAESGELLLVNQVP